MSRIGSTDILASTAVRITADLDPLKAGIAEAKQLVGSTEKLGLRMPVMLADNGLRLSSDVNRLLQSLQAQVNANPLRIPVVVGSGGGVGAGVGGGGGGGAAPVTLGTVNRGAGEGASLMSGRAGTGVLSSPASGAGRISGFSIGSSGAQTVSANFTPARSATEGNPFAGEIAGMRQQLAGIGGGAGAASVVAPALGMAATARAGLNSGLGAAGAGLFAAFSGIGLARAGSAYAASRAVSDPGLRRQYEAEYENSLNGASFGLRSVARETVPNMLGYETSRQRDISEGNRIESEAGRRDRQTERIFARSSANQKIISAGNLAHQTIGMSSTGANVASSREALRQWDGTNGVLQGNTTGLSQSARQARETLIRAIGDAVKQDAAAASSALRSGALEASAISLSGSVARIGVSAGSVAAGRAGMVGGNALAEAATASEVQTLLDSGASVNDPRVQSLNLRLAAQREAGTAQVAAADTQNLRSFRSRDRAFKMRAQIRTQRLMGNEGAAERMEIGLAAAERIDADTAEFGAGSVDVQRDAAERDQAEGDSLRAQLTSARRSRRLARHRQFVEAPRERALQTAAADRSANTRVGIANASGNNQNQLAGVIGMIGQMREEMIAQENSLRPDLAGKLATVQRAELGSIQKQVLRPNQYATEFDPLREARGGPGGESGKEVTELLKAIAEYLKEIKDKGGGLAN